MSDPMPAAGLSARLAHLLPYLRRYARALTGNQTTGDQYALATLQSLVNDTGVFVGASTEKVALFQAFHRIWTAEPTSDTATDAGIAAQAQSYLRTLTPQSRQALLLLTIEDFTPPQIAEILGISQQDATDLITLARQQMHDQIKGRIMVIEDEAIIAMDLQDIVTGMGHQVVGVAATHKQAVALAAQEGPDLILSDIQLADGSSGAEAVAEILTAAADTPVIFITAFPERLLTGDRKEPAFVITKPYSTEQISSAVSQAMFFRSSAAISI